MFSKVMDQQLALRMQKLHKKFAKQATAQHAFDLPNIIHQLTNAKDNFSANRNNVPPGIPYFHYKREYIQAMRKWRKTVGTRGSINLRAPNFEEKLDGKKYKEKILSTFQDLIRASSQKSPNSLLSILYNAEDDEQDD